MTGAELSCKTCTVVMEVKYFSTQNVVIHTKNCKLKFPLDCSTTKMENISVECVALTKVEERIPFIVWVLV